MSRYSCTNCKRVYKNKLHFKRHMQLECGVSRNSFSVQCVASLWYGKRLLLFTYIWFIKWDLKRQLLWNILIVLDPNLILHGLHKQDLLNALNEVKFLNFTFIPSIYCEPKKNSNKSCILIWKVNIKVVVLFSSMV